MTTEAMLSSTLRGDEMKSLREAALLGVRSARFAASACEDWGATPNSTLTESVDQARKASVYLLVLGNRYGTECSPGDPRSYTEIEFDEATDAGVPRLAFIQDPYTVDSTAGPTETAKQVLRREQFKQKVLNSGITAKTFSTPEQLKGDVALALLRMQLKSNVPKQAVQQEQSKQATNPFRVVHEYALLDTDLAGRVSQLGSLSRWSEGGNAIMVLEAFGGFGKTALSWWWWDSQKRNGRWHKGLWFSFYEPGATTLEFFAQVYAHLANEPLVSARKRTLNDLADATLQLARDDRCLIVMDGFERMLVRASSLNANEEVLDERHEGEGMAPSADAHARSPRSIQDPLLAQWLLKVANQARSRVLITTRYHPTNLETIAGKPRRGVERLELRGLQLAEARDYWRSIGLDENDSGLERLVAGVHGHPLSLSVMAGNLKASGHRSLWEFFGRRPDFPLFGQHVRRVDGRDDVFQDALSNLSDGSRTLLRTIAVYAVPAPLRDLQRLLCPPDLNEEQDQDEFRWERSRSVARDLPGVANFDGFFADQDEFLTALLDLEDRKLVSRNPENGCDMHPVIRSVVRDRAPKDELERSDLRLVDYYAQTPRTGHADDVEELFGEIQLVFSATRAGMWQKAFEVFLLQLHDDLHRLNELRWIANIGRQFFLLDNRNGSVVARWRLDTPFIDFQLPPFKNLVGKGTDALRDALRRQLMEKHGFTADDVMSYFARRDLSMAAAIAHESLGEYEIAKALFAIHNRSCFEPLCLIMQAQCYKQAGRFGEAFSAFREGVTLLNSHEYWRRDPFELRRLAHHIFDECIDRHRLQEARLALARENKIVRTWSERALGSAYTVSEWLRLRNLQVARLAQAEGQQSVAIDISREVVEHATNANHALDHLNALRQLAESLRAAGRFEEAHPIFDQIVSMAPDAVAQTSALDDRANRARNRIGLGHLDEARSELDDVIAMASTAKATRAKALIYKSELWQKQADPKAEVAALVEALGEYARHFGTPMDTWGVRSCLERLNALNARDKAQVHRRQFVELAPWPRDLLTGTDAAKVTALDAAFPLRADWSLSGVAVKAPSIARRQGTARQIAPSRRRRR